MIRTKFSKDDVKSDCVCSFRIQFLGQPPINLARPIKSKRLAEQALSYAGDTMVIDSHEAQIRGDFGWIFKSLPTTHIVGHQFRTLNKGRIHDPDQTDHSDQSERNQSRNALGGRQRHAIKKTKKPKLHKAALVLKKEYRSIYWPALTTASPPPGLPPFAFTPTVGET